ncbi:hypothetical protein [Mycolicibacterium llatzerense]|uniref:hypothetical protein n=1 Tax=Mycolicibacterium llatzerense TaxID=280871 RepID=UPI0019551924|nr:hypothetical protein [Mycolicibacterium llatzerense]
MLLRECQDQFAQFIDTHRLHYRFQRCVSRGIGGNFDGDTSAVDCRQPNRDQMLAEIAFSVVRASADSVGQRARPIELNLVDPLGLNRGVGLGFGDAKPANVTDVVLAAGEDEIAGDVEQRRFGERHVTMVPDATVRTPAAPA